MGLPCARWERADNGDISPLIRPDPETVGEGSGRADNGDNMSSLKRPGPDIVGDVCGVERGTFPLCMCAYKCVCVCVRVCICV